MTALVCDLSKSCSTAPRSIVSFPKLISSNALALALKSFPPAAVRPVFQLCCRTHIACAAWSMEVAANAGMSSSCLPGLQLCLCMLMRLRAGLTIGVARMERDQHPGLDWAEGLLLSASSVRSAELVGNGMGLLGDVACLEAVHADDAIRDLEVVPGAADNQDARDARQRKGAYPGHQRRDGFLGGFDQSLHTERAPLRILCVSHSPDSQSPNFPCGCPGTDFMQGLTCKGGQSMRSWVLPELLCWNELDKSAQSARRTMLRGFLGRVARLPTLTEGTGQRRVLPRPGSGGHWPACARP